MAVVALCTILTLSAQEDYHRAQLYFEPEQMPDMKPNKNGVAEVFSLLKENEGAKANNSVELYSLGITKGTDISRYQLIFATEVLEDLGIIYYTGGRLRYDRKIKTDINNSKIFKKFSERN